MTFTPNRGRALLALLLTLLTLLSVGVAYAQAPTDYSESELRGMARNWSADDAGIAAKRAQLAPSASQLSGVIQYQMHFGSTKGGVFDASKVVDGHGDQVDAQLISNGNPPGDTWANVYHVAAGSVDADGQWIIYPPAGWKFDTLSQMAASVQPGHTLGSVYIPLTMHRNNIDNSRDTAAYTAVLPDVYHPDYPTGGRGARGNGPGAVLTAQDQEGGLTIDDVRAAVHSELGIPAGQTLAQSFGVDFAHGVGFREIIKQKARDGTVQALHDTGFDSPSRQTRGYDQNLMDRFYQTLRDNGLLPPSTPRGVTR